MRNLYLFIILDIGHRKYLVVDVTPPRGGTELKGAGGEWEWGHTLAVGLVVLHLRLQHCLGISHSFLAHQMVNENITVNINKHDGDDDDDGITPSQAHNIFYFNFGTISARAGASSTV